MPTVGSGGSKNMALSAHDVGFAPWKPPLLPLTENKVEFIILQFFKTASLLTPRGEKGAFSNPYSVAKN